MLSCVLACTLYPGISLHFQPLGFSPSPSHKLPTPYNRAHSAPSPRYVVHSHTIIAPENPSPKLQLDGSQPPRGNSAASSITTFTTLSTGISEGTFLNLKWNFLEVN
jgi:hypothetical protein